MSKTFKNKFNFDTRTKESSKILTKYPDRIPIIVSRSKNSTLPELEKSKFLVPSDLTLGQFQTVLRKRIKLADTEAIFIFINDTKLCTGSDNISNLYDENKDDDGFLYITYCSENVFG